MCILLRKIKQMSVMLFVCSGPNRGHYITIVKSHGFWLLFDDDIVEVSSSCLYLRMNQADCSLLLSLVSLILDLHHTLILCYSIRASLKQRLLCQIVSSF